MKNSQLSIKKKFYAKFVECFSGHRISEKT